MIGKTIGKYRFVERLGRGGMGTVYKAIDETLEREVAVKVLNPGLTDDEVMKRFRTEATTLAKLNHPEIATIHEIHRSDTDLLMVMELVRGETLDQLSQRSGPLPPERAAYLVSQVLGALEHAHRAGIVHRDLKPANIMVTEHGGVKIMDFGIARVVGSEHLTSDGHMMGTPAYMAPEQVMTKDVDGRADIYACGVIFYRLLTGTLPFQADTAIGMVQKQLSESPTPVYAHRADLPDWCGAILDRALAKSPADRYQTAAEFQSALQSAIGSAATEHTGVYAAARLGLTPPPISIAAVAAAATPPPSPSPVQAAAPPAAASAAAKVAKPNPATEGATIVLQRNHFAMAGVLLTVVAAGVAVLAVVALRRPTATATSAAGVNSPATQSAQAAPAPEATPTPAEAPAIPAPTPAPAAPAPEPSAKTPAPAAAAPDADKTPPIVPAKRSDSAAPPKESKPAPGAPATAPAPATMSAPAAAAAAGGASGALPPFSFDAKTVVVDGGKNRERDASVTLADGTITVTDRNKRVVSAVPYNAVQGIFYSNSKQPMWNSPSGPAEAVKVEGGTFGFLKGGRNWVVMNTKDATLVLRVDDEHTHRVLSAIEERAGRKVERIASRDR